MQEALTALNSFMTHIWPQATDPMRHRGSEKSLDADHDAQPGPLQHGSPGSTEETSKYPSIHPRPQLQLLLLTWDTCEVSSVDPRDPC